MKYVTKTILTKAIDWWSLVSKYLFRIEPTEEEEDDDEDGHDEQKMMTSIGFNQSWMKVKHEDKITFSVLF